MLRGKNDITYITINIENEVILQHNIDCLIFFLKDISRICKHYILSFKVQPQHITHECRRTQMSHKNFEISLCLCEMVKISQSLCEMV